MARGATRTAISIAAEKLRAIVLDAPPDSFIGSEDALIAQLGCSRSTVRQIARLLEREGLLSVKRGINGGYFGTRPSAGTIEATVSAYLETLDMDIADVAIVASALWVEAVRKAAMADDRDEVRALVELLRRRVRAIGDDATFEEVRDLEQFAQAQVFTLVRSSYIKLIFDINVAFSRRNFPIPHRDQAGEAHRRFVRAWREAKLLELNAIEDGDADMAYLAGRHSRKIWQERVLPPR